VEAFIAQAKAEFDWARHGLIRAIETTPEDRLRWSPSETARSPLEVAAHAAIAVGSMLGNLKGDTFAIPTTDEADLWFREEERQCETPSQVVELLERNSRDYFEWLDALSQEVLESDIALPFGMGRAPMPAAISFMPLHIHWHAAQIQYIQTIYGDRQTHL
jgi:hypothetical protein